MQKLNERVHKTGELASEIISNELGMDEEILSSLFGLKRSDNTCQRQHR